MPSLAQILGISDANNRRDHICSAMLLHEGRMVQVLEGKRADIDRLLRRMERDLRLRRLQILADQTIQTRVLTEAAGYCPEPSVTLAKVGLDDLHLITVADVEAMLEYRHAA